MNKQKWLKRLDRYKYFIVLSLFFVDIVFFDENSVIHRYHQRQQIVELRQQIADYKQQYARDTRSLQLLESDPKQIERVARERYFMKTADEDLYVFRRKSTTPTP